MAEVVDQAQLLRQVRLALQNGNYAGAVESLQQAVTLARASNDPAAEGRHLGNLALIYYRLKQTDDALHHFELALKIARSENDRLTEDGILGNMGNILREVRRYEEAIDYLNQALLIAQEIGDVRGRGIWLSNLGLVYDDLGRTTEAVEVHKESVNVARLMRDQKSLVARLSNQGNSHLAAGQHTEAIKCFHEVVALYKTLGEQPAAALRMGIIGNIYNDLGRAAATEFEARFYFELARDTYRETLGMAQEMGDTVAEGDLLTSLGGVLGNMGNYDEAIEQFSAAYHIFSTLNLADRLPQLEENLKLAHQLRDQVR
ncbi:MAG: tetratricopeptide repeat protein [Anaerolineae bacterium]